MNPFWFAFWCAVCGELAALAVELWVRAIRYLL